MSADPTPAIAGSRNTASNATPQTDAMQLVKMREHMEEVAPPAAASEAFAPLRADSVRNAELVSFDVSGDWIEDVRAVTKDTPWPDAHVLLATFWLTEEQKERLRPLSPKSHGGPRVDE